MKRNTSKLVIALMTFLLIGSGAILKAQTPAAALWLNQTDFGYDSTSKVYTINLEWAGGFVDNEHPQAENFNVYRSMIGHDEEIEDFDLVGTATDANIEDGVYKFNDEMMISGGYFYYVRGFIGEELGELSPVIQAFSPGSYCVRMDAPIVDFKSFPVTIAIPGEKYEYQAYAKHRSDRVQGWVRYTLLEGPEGLTIDNKDGLVEWEIPEDAEGSYYVQIKATSNEDERAESIQEWYIRIANEDEMKYKSTSVSDIIYNKNLSVFPCPASDQVSINYNAVGNRIQVEITSTNGQLVSRRKLSAAQGEGTLNIPVGALSTGTYFLKIIDNNKVSFGKVIISR